MIIIFRSRQNDESNWAILSKYYNHEFKFDLVLRSNQISQFLLQLLFYCLTFKSIYLADYEGCFGSCVMSLLSERDFLSRLPLFEGCERYREMIIQQEGHGLLWHRLASFHTRHFQLPCQDKDSCYQCDANSGDQLDQHESQLREESYCCP